MERTAETKLSTTFIIVDDGEGEIMVLIAFVYLFVFDITHKVLRGGGSWMKYQDGTYFINY